jgi:hypothetical protein
VEVRRCYTLHALLAALDELLGQAQQAQQADAQPQDIQQQQQQRRQQQAAQAQHAGQGPGAAPHPPQPAARRRLSELPVGLLVVDSLSALVGPLLGGGQHSQGHALLAAAAAALKAFAAASGAGEASLG